MEQDPVSDTGTHPLHIGIVAGEPSGDRLAAGLLGAIRSQIPDALIEGIGGPKMERAGCYSLYPMEQLSVMGLTEVLNRLPSLLRIRRELYHHFSANPPDIFIGVDAPDFNLGLEKKLKRRGIRTVHYVSPSVWAWRQWRVRRIGQSVDRMLVLFPFERKFYRKHNVPVEYIGHPFADAISDTIDRKSVRRLLGYCEDDPIVALLPGSRISEVKRLSGCFTAAADWCHKRNSSLKFVAPMANEACRKIFTEALGREAPYLQVKVLSGRPLEAMAAADAVLTASGTATLEALLLRRPMVVAYRMSSLSHAIISRLARVPYYSLPNLLAGRSVVPELIQNEATAESLGQALLEVLENPAHNKKLESIFSDIHRSLRRNAHTTAADIILEMAGR